MDYLFKERQRFNQWWLWLILIGANGFVLFFIKGLMAHSMNIGLWLGAIITLLSAISFYFFILETRISEKGIHVRFFPFHFSFITIPWDKIEKVEIRQYRPLGEFGGWGLRYSSSGKAYNVSGDIGIQLTLKDQSNLLIGTNKKNEVEVILKKLAVV
jgi:hypothetical protein